MAKIKKHLGFIGLGLVLSFMGISLDNIMEYVRPDEISIAGVVGSTTIALIGLYLIGSLAWAAVVVNIEYKEEGK